MQTVTINFTASGQTLKVTSLPIKIASNTVKYVKAVFALDSDWTGFDVVSAIWYNDFAQIAVVLDENGECMIPHEVLAKPDDVMVNLVGRDIVNDELVDRLTTYPAKALDVDANAKITGTETAPVTPSQFEQYIAIVEQLVGSVKDIDHTELNADYTLTIYYTDGTSDTVGPIRGAQGETGNGILSAVLNPDYTLTLNYTNGQHDTVGPIRGAQGETGNGIQSIYLTGTSGAVKTYTILFADGNTTEFQVTDGEVTNAVLESLMPTDTANGSIASFPDGQSVFPLKSLVADINPIQDLHGYDSPWVGGGGVNKYNTSSWELTTSRRTWGSDSPTMVSTLNSLGAGTYTIVAKIKIDALTQGDTDDRRYGFLCTGVSVDARTTTAPPTVGSVVTVAKSFTISSEQVGTFTHCYWYAGSVTATSDLATIYDVGINQGSETNFVPYSNICPISGWNSVEVIDDPTYGGFIYWNQFARVRNGSESYTANGVKCEFDSATNSFKLSGTSSNTYCGVLDNLSLVAGHKYIIQTKVVANPNNITFKYSWLNANVRVTAGNSAIVTASNTQVTNSGFADYPNNTDMSGIKIRVMICDLTQMFGSGNEPTTVDEFKAIFPNDYYAYNSGTKTNASAVNGTPYISHTTTLPSTVYGGTLDVVSGVLTVEWVGVNLGSLSWTAGGNNIYYTPLTDSGQPTDNALYSDRYQKSTQSSWSNTENGHYLFQYNNNKRLFIHDDNYTTKEAFTTGVNGSTLLYPLATPTTIQLTPTQVQTLLGQNNIFADSGDVSVEYVADIQGYIDKKL